MNRNVHFWFTMLVRGFLALFAGSAILLIPDMARTLLLLPIAITVAILGLAAYGVFDSVLVFISSFMVETRSARMALRAQGIIGTAVGILLLSVVFDRVQLEWFLSLAALQALSAGVGEIVVARHEHQRSISLWNYSAGIAALLFAITYLALRVAYSSFLTHRQISWLVYAYLLAFGIAQCLTAARMIYAGRHLALATAKSESADAELAHRAYQRSPLARS